MIYTNKGRRKEDNTPFNSALALDNEKLRKALEDSEADNAKLKSLLDRACAVINCDVGYSYPEADALRDEIESLLLTHPAK